MIFDISNFRQVSYSGGQRLYFDKRQSFHEYFNHKRRTKRFPYHQNILQFLLDNNGVDIFFTLDENVKSFQKVDQGFIVNMSAYFDFCKVIGSRTGGRSKAFLGQNININDLTVSQNDKDQFIKANATEKNILEAVHNLPKSVQNSIVSAMVKSTDVTTDDLENRHINQDEFVSAFSNFLTNQTVQTAFYSNLPKFQIEILKSHVSFLKDNLDKNETFIQNWIDEDNGKYRKQRCLIFGLEYVDPKREGQVSSKEFDILAEQDLEHYVIFELKSPKDPVFRIESNPMSAGGISTEYNLSPQLSRAIPEVLGYKELYLKSTNEELQKIGITIRKQISKCVIVIGTRENDPVWKDNFERIASCFNGVELLTYNHLIDRLENIVKNLEENTIQII